MTQEIIDNKHVPEVTNIELYILAELCNKDLHGLGLIQAISNTTNQQIFLSPGTLYTALKRLYKNRWITESEIDNSDVDGNALRRRYYRLTSNGRNIIESEISRMENLCNLLRVALGTEIEETVNEILA